MDPEFQNQGIGQKLLALVEEKIHEQNVQYIRCSSVEQRTDLLDWYKRKGFEIIGRYPWPKELEYLLIPPNVVNFCFVTSTRTIFVQRYK